jgi:hypothetical protein
MPLGIEGRVESGQGAMPGSVVAEAHGRMSCSKDMSKGNFTGAVAALMMMCALSCAAQDKGYWRAISSSANDITGDIAVSDTRLTINFSPFTLAQIRKLTPAEASAAFGADINEGGSGNLYRLTVPAAKRFLHKNTLCGSEDTQWMATYVTGRTMQVAFFSGDNMPVITPEALANSTDVCGTFGYSR